MKILIWIHKNDVIANKILTYYYTRPYTDRHDDYVQVEITQEQFVKLEDDATTGLSKTAKIVEDFFNDDIEYAQIRKPEGKMSVPEGKEFNKPYSQSTEALIARHKTKLSSERMKIENQDKFQEKSISLKAKNNDWLVDQYNRNRDKKDWVKTRSEIPYIYERNGNDVYRRREGDAERELITNDEFHASKKEIKKGLKQLLIELQTVSGGNFANWWKGLTKDEQITLTKFWE